MMKMLDGRALAVRIRETVAERAKELSKKPGLAIILVGNDPASHLYVELKEKACGEVGFYFEKHLLPEDTSTEAIIELIEKLNVRPDIHGILVQLPLPSQDENAVVAAINPAKDVDGFHPTNLERLEIDKPCLAPPTVLGIMKLIESTGEDVAGRRAAVVGSEFFARPIQTLLSRRRVRVDRLDPTGISLQEKTCIYDILITVVGKPGLITSAMIKPGAIVIDVGTTRMDDKTLGDVSPEATEKNTGWLTPVPGGVGPMTVAMLLLNVLKAAQFPLGALKELSA